MIQRAAGKPCVIPEPDPGNVDEGANSKKQCRII